MCCFHLHFSDFTVLFKKTCCSLLLKKKLCTKREKEKREKTTCLEEKSRNPPRISNGPSLSIITLETPIKVYNII